MSRSPSPLVHDIAARIEASLDALEGSQLPSRAALARAYGVSHATMSAALGLLKEKGLIELYRGRRMRRAGGSAEGDSSTGIPARRSAAVRLYEMLAERIAEGKLPAGHPLPKIGYYVLERCVTNRTVRAAYALLVERGLAHGEGKRWIVGPQTAPRGRVKVGKPPFILILQKKGTSWSHLWTPRTEGFPRAFSAEAARCGVQLISAYTTVELAPTGLHLAGRDRILSFLHAKAERYAGTLMVDRASELPDITAWVDLLGGLGKPVAWFDAFDEPRRFHQGPPAFTRCHFSEERAVSVALAHLAERGHRRLAYFNIAPEPWRLARLKLVLEKAGRFIPPLEVIATSPAEFLWADREAAEIDAILHSLRADKALATSGVFESLLKEVHDCRGLLPKEERGLLPSGLFAKVVACIRAAALGLAKPPYRVANYLGALYLNHTLKGLLSQSVTAILAPNDQDARSFNTWLNMAGIAVPERLSLLSFDNYQALHPLLPVSTVDFGFPQLGYAAFHFILGDVPVAKDRSGAIGAKPFVVDRGSVDEPPS